MNQPRTRVLVVDDAVKLREAWKRLLGGTPDLECVGTLDSADGLAVAAAEHNADLILMDLDMRGADPFDAIAEVARLMPEVRVVICSGYSDSHTVREAARAGVRGFADKLSEPKEIMETMRRVIRGERVYPAGMG